jgi:aquaporin Z
MDSRTLSFLQLCIPLAPYIVEFVGTMFLTLEVGLVGHSVIGALGVMAMLLAFIFAGGNISGGAYNPAVVIALFCRGKLNWFRALLYIIVEFLGSFIGAALAFWIGKNKCYYPYPHYDEDLGEALVVELLFTLAFCYVILSVETSTATKDNQYYGIAIAFTLMAGVIATGEISGAAINPALGFTLPLVNGVVKKFWIYLVGPSIGAVLAAGLFVITNPKEFTGDSINKAEIDFAASPSTKEYIVHKNYS